LSEIIINKATVAEYPAAQEFYATVGYFSPIQSSDNVLIAREAGHIVGVVRLAYEQGHTIMRGMYIADNMQGKGIGTQLLHALTAEIGDTDCYCLPTDEGLVRFYSQIGFVRIPDKQAPPHLYERMMGYRAKEYPGSIVMMRKSH